MVEKIQTKLKSQATNSHKLSFRDVPDRLFPMSPGDSE